jgi:hypothetical protein
MDKYLVLTAESEALKLQKQLNDKAAEGYRLVGVSPRQEGVQARTFIILEREMGPAAGAIRQQPPRA